MRSAFAVFLRGFVLPFGTTTGRRIVFDGDNGRILFYNTAGVLVGRAEPDGAGDMTFEVMSADGARAGLFTNASNVARLILDPADVPGHIITEAVLQSSANAGPPARPHLQIIGPSVDGLNTPTITLLSENATSTQLAQIAMDAPDYSLADDVGNFRSVPRGVIKNGSLRITASDDSARAAGVNTDMSLTARFIAGRVYPITLNAELAPGVLNSTMFVELHDGTANVGRFWGSVIVGIQQCGQTIMYYPQTSGTKTLTVRNGTGSSSTLALRRGSGIPARTLVACDGGAIADAT